MEMDGTEPGDEMVGIGQVIAVVEAVGQNAAAELVRTAGQEHASRS